MFYRISKCWYLLGVWRGDLEETLYQKSPTIKNTGGIVRRFLPQSPAVDY